MHARHRQRCRLVLTALLLALAPATWADETPTTGGTLLRVGTSGDYQPFSFRNATGELVGFDIAVAQRLGADLGRPLEFVPFHWPELTEQLRAGTFDLAMSGVTVRPDRALTMVFTRPYAVTGAVAVIRTRDRAKFRDIKALDHQRIRLAVNRGGHLEQIARATFAHAQVTAIVNNSELPELLRDGRADAVVSEELEARTWPAAEFLLLAPFSRDRKAYALAPRAASLLPQVDAWLAAREADGWLNAQRRQWLGEQTMLTPQQAGIQALVAAMELRLQLMPFVAAVKRREHLPIEDPAQEARVLEHVRRAARVAGLEPEGVAGFFRVQMEAAKLVEQRNPSVRLSVENVSLPELRAAVVTVSDQIITELARCRPWLADRAFHGEVERSVHAGMTAVGLPPPVLTKLIDALLRVGGAR